MIPESGGRDSAEETEDQRIKNNLAVKRSRMKSRQKMSIMVNRCGKLRQENTLLELKADALMKELAFLKEMFLAHASDKKESAISQADLERIMSDELPGPQLPATLSGCTADLDGQHELEVPAGHTGWSAAVTLPLGGDRPAGV